MDLNAAVLGSRHHLHSWDILQISAFQELGYWSTLGIEETRLQNTSAHRAIGYDSNKEAAGETKEKKIVI
ncbi:hypothetical protein Pmani_011325 [Petrolisthes manimaculis]|uniref:Uncharacterized protein n=1 Tax=Petrolisthes manimaculis TaxID=1843537 RepID=A0AAE1PZW2_9EUCA|nr:hypothetical protein Pmani_011325 [Petrolisthes manimaculis]